ncbi:hypothetical protein ACJQWK_09347 [Exserohilum turcicum]
MSTLMRTLRNLRRIGFKASFSYTLHCCRRSTNSYAGLCPPNGGDTKAGTLIGTDKYGNKFFENLEEELPLRTRWVDYKDKEYDPSQIEPGWHAWISYMVDKSPAEDKLLQRQIRVWEPKEHRPTLTWSRSGYKPYSTTKNKYSAWTPVAKPRA